VCTCNCVSRCVHHVSQPSRLQTPCQIAT
jgi:hypothetical protein